MRLINNVSLISFLTPAPLLAVQEGGGGLFSVDPGLTIWTIAVFLLVLFVLGKFAWGPILGVLDSREAGIRDAIEDAARMRREAEEALEEHRKQLTDSRRQVQELLANGREAGERVRNEIESKAREESDRMLERARNEIERERDRALERIRRESVDLALAAASRLIQQRLDGAADRALIEGYLDELNRPAAGA